MRRWVVVLLLMLACSVGDGDVGVNDDQTEVCWLELIGAAAPAQSAHAEADVTGISWPADGYTVDLEFRTAMFFAQGDPGTNYSWLYEMKDFGGPPPTLAVDGIGCYFDAVPTFLTARIIFSNVSNGGALNGSYSPIFDFQVDTHYFVRFTCGFVLGNCVMQVNINGILYPPFPIGVPCHPVVVSRDFRIGARFDGVDYLYGASIHLYQMRIALETLPPADFTGEMTGYPFTPHASDMVRYNCDEGAGVILHDEANGYDATLFESVYWDWHCRGIGYGEARGRGR